MGAWALIGVAGLVAAWRLPVALFPDVVFPVIVVGIDAPGTPAASVERQWTVPVERRLLALHDRDTVTSTTFAGRAMITVPFDVGLSLDTAEGRVRAALTGLPVSAPNHLSIQRVDVNETPIAIACFRSRSVSGPARSCARQWRYPSSAGC